MNNYLVLFVVLTTVELIGVCFTCISGLKIALGMQKQITAKREQTDFLQSRVQLLEEKIEKLKMVRCITNNSFLFLTIRTISVPM